MSEATVVGSTRVSLIPDVSQFGDRLRIELPAVIREPAKAAGASAGDLIREGITKKLLKPIQVKVTASLDDTAARAGLTRLTRDRTVKVTAELDDKAATASLTRLTSDRKVTITAEVDDTAAKAKLGVLSGQQTVDILPTIQQAAYRTAERQLARLVQDRVVNIRASVDTRVAANDINNLIRRRQVRIDADVDTRAGAASLANLTRRRSMTIQADVDTAAAATRLAALTRDRTVNVRVRSLGLGSLTQSLNGLGGSGGGGAGVAALSGRVLALAGAAASALPAIASLGSAIAQMGPLAATAAPAVAMLAGTFAAIKVGTTGVSDAIKAAFQPAAGEATKAASATKQVENAQRSLAQAQRSLSDARIQASERVRQANQQVTTAERNLSTAQRDARQAQQDLTAARRQAVRDLEDMNTRLKDGRLSEREATLAVQQAEEDLAQVRSDPAATQLQIEQAALARDRAVQSLEEQRTELDRLKTDTAAANKAGVNGSKAVVQARQQVAAADQQVADQQRTLVEAQRDVVKAQVDGQRQVADAQQSVADALDRVADAQQTAAAQTSKLDQAMAKLSPNARAFVGTLQAMAPAWRSMRLDVQDALFSGLGTRLGQVGTQVLPTVRQGLVGAATELNLMGKNALTAVSNLEKTGQLRQVFDGIKQSLGNVSRIPGQMVTGFAQLSIAAQPAFDRISQGAAGAMDRVMAKLSAGLKDGSLTDAINTALDVALQFGKVLGDIGGIFAGIFKAASTAGGNFFGTIGAALAEIRRVIELPEVQAALVAIFKALNAVAKLLAGALGAAIEAILPVIAAMAPVIQQLAEQLGPVLAQIFGELGKALMPVIQALMPIILDVVNVIADLAVMALPLLKPLGELIGAILVALTPLIQMIGQNLMTAMQAFVTFLTPVIMALIPAVQMFGDLFAQLAPLFPPLYQALLPLIPPLTELALALLTLAMDVITPLMPLVIGLAQLLTGVLAAAIGFLVPIISTVIGWITDFVKAVSDGVKWVVDGFKWLFDVLLGHSIIPDIVRGAIDWFGRMWKGLKELVTKIVTGVVGRFADLKDGAVKVWDSFWGRVKSIASGAWKLVREGFDTFGDGLKDAFKSVRDSIGDVWSGIKKLVAAPIRFWVDTVYNNGIVKVWNATAGRIPHVPNLDPLNVKGFARGGILPGWSSWRDGDDQLVPMRRGEGVYVSEVMADPYERARLHAMNQAAIRGQHPAIARAQYGFSEGGIFGAISDAGSSIVSKVGGALKKGANAVRGGLADVAEAAFKPVKSGITAALGKNTGSWPGMVAAAPLNFIDRAIDYIRGKDIPDATGSWIKPVNVPYGTKFGVKGSMWSSGRHTGLDFPAATGTKVVAVDNGTVKSATSGGPYGKHVLINHGGGLQSLYAHMSAIAAKVGSGITQGGRVGSVGATGNVTGPHLHLEARINGKSVDPMSYLTGGGGDGGSGVQRWKGVVTQALGQVHQSLGLVNTTLRRMNQESGGNPRAVNLWDSNAKAGHPSVGLMQVIRGTFQAYAGKYRNTGPFMHGVSVDPMANIYASMKYALANYGSLSRAYNRPGGYALGGLVGGIRVGRGLPRGYASGGVIRVGGKRINTGPIASAVGSDFLKQLTGTAAQISAAMNKVATAVKNAFKGVKTTLDNRLLAQISGANKQLQFLAKQRDAIAAKMAAAEQLRADSVGQASSFAQMTSLPNGGNTFDAGGILSGLKVRLSQIRDFGKNIRTLAARGLSKALLQQIISAGPDGGAAYAKALVDATPAQLKELNAVQTQISSAAGQYGKTAADAMYDAGAKSGQGYLTGLKAQETAINNAMSGLAKKIQAAIRKALKIKSPSRVFAQLGAFTVQGFAQGMRAATPEAAATAARMAALVRGSAAATASRIENNTTSTTVGDRVLNYQATTREVASRQSILDALALEDALHRPVVVGG